MKNKKIIFILLALVMVFITLKFFSKDDEVNKIVETQENVAEVTNRTILTKLTAPGEVNSAVNEKISLNTGYYFLTLCAEKEDFIKKGDNLLKYTNGKYITAPYDCILMEYSVPNAKDICTKDNYIYIVSTEDLYMDINIAEDELQKISLNQEVEITVGNDESKRYNGTISKISSIGTSNSGVTKFAAIASLKNDGTLKLGMSATCTITIEKNENLLTLPIEAIEIENDTKYVNLIGENDEKTKIKIETGKADANYVEIKSGLSLGDKVYYETSTITIIEDNEENSENSLTSLFNFGPNRRNSNKGGNAR